VNLDKTKKRICFNKIAFVLSKELIVYNKVYDIYNIINMVLVDKFMVLKADNKESKFTVRILEKEYPIEGNIPQERLIKIENYLNQHLKKLMELAPMVPVGRLAILACLNITNELYEQKSIYKNRLSDYQKQIDGILQTIDNALDI